MSAVGYSEELLSGETYLFNDYDLLGKGGYGQVYRATRQSDGKKFALKFMFVDIDNNFESFSRELNAGSLFNSQFLLKTLDFKILDDEYKSDPFDSKIALVSALANGGDLINYMSKNGPSLSIDDKLRLIKDVVNGLYILNENGYYHCDIKSDNVFVNDNRAILADFSIVRPMYVEGYCATTHYSSPQNLNRYRSSYSRIEMDIVNASLSSDGKFFNYDYQTRGVDTWSIGALIFFILTGEELFDHTNIVDEHIELSFGVRDFLLDRMKIDESDVNRDKILKFLFNIMTQCLDVNPDTRITVDDLYNEMEKMVKDGDLNQYRSVQSEKYSYSPYPNDIHFSDSKYKDDIERVIKEMVVYAKKINMPLDQFYYGLQLAYLTTDYIIQEKGGKMDIIDYGLLGRICFAIVNSVLYSDSNLFTGIKFDYNEDDVDYVRTTINTILKRTNGRIINEFPSDFVKEYNHTNLENTYKIITNPYEYEKLYNSSRNVRFDLSFSESLREMRIRDLVI